MAVTRVTTTLKGEKDAEVTANAPRYNITLTNGSGNDRFLLVLPLVRRGGTRTLTSVTVDPAGSPSTGTVWQSVSVDGGQACSSGVAYFLDADLPASSGATSIDVLWSANNTSSPAIFIEFTGVDQTNPLESFASTTQTGQAEGGTISATLSGSSGKYALSYLAIADGSDLPAATHTVPSGMTDLGDAQTAGTGNSSRASISAAEIASAASASEAYQWTYDYGGALNLDSIITATLAVNEAAGGGVTIDASTENISSSGSPSLISLDRSISSGLESIETQTFQSSVTLGVSIQAGQESISATVNNGLVTLDVAIPASQELITITGLASVVSLTTGTVINAGTESVDSQVFASSVQLSPVVPASPEIIDVSSFQSVVSLGQVVSANIENIEVGTNNAIIVFNPVISGQLENIDVSGLQAVIEGASGVWVVQPDNTAVWVGQADDGSTWTIQ